MNTRLDIIDNEIYQVTFDRPDSGGNIFDRATIEELNRHLDALAGDTGMRGLVFTSAKPTIFIAGADINELLVHDLPEADLREMVRAGQQLFQRIADLPIPTVAAIHGACLGGGYELCLACDIRLASDDRVTRIGLPETNLGILPAWGGCTRLPRLIGLPKALNVILNGRRLAARQAKKFGMVDEVVPKEHFLRRTRARIAEGKPTRPAHAFTNNRLAAAIIAHRARAVSEQKTRGHYPAIPRALEVVSGGVTASVGAALTQEEHALVDLVRTDVSANLVRIFFMQERSKRLRISDVEFVPAGSEVPPDAGKARMAVIGSGVMGAGIAQWASTRGHPVILRDINEEQVLKGMAAAGKIYAGGVKRHVFSKTEARRGMELIQPSACEVPLDRCEFVIEAAVEKMDIKKSIFKDLAALAQNDTILATNTSALSITEIAADTPSPERVIGIHFFNPVHRMQLVEIVVGEQTAPEVVARTLRFVQKLGKMPVVVKDRPGFVVNRILMPYLSEAGHLFEQGAPTSEIDATMLDYGMPMGPLRLIDEVGVDVANHVASFFGVAFGDRMPVPDVLSGMCEAGLLGRKAGSGFYVYGGKKGKEQVNPAVRPFVTQDGARAMSRADLGERMVLVMLNEAARCIEEGVVSEPQDIDFAMIMGTGFAPFRGGPLRYADAVGAQKITRGLYHLAEDEDPRFEPCELLVSMANDNKRFYPDE